MSIELTSPAFSEGEMIPTRYTCDGEDISPSLVWSGVPQAAQSLPLEAGSTKAQLLEAMEGHILDQGQLVGRYQRQGT